MIKFAIRNPAKWKELELSRIISTFKVEYDEKVFDFLNNPSNEPGFLRTLTPEHRSDYEKLPNKFYNDDIIILDSAYLFAENIMVEQTEKLLSENLAGVRKMNIFNTLEKVAAASKKILDEAVIEEVDDFEEWRAEMAKKISGEFKIIESSILTDNLPFLPSEMTILAARPSMGKTAMALSLCLELIEKGLRVKFISAEMPIKRIIDRLASYYTGISTRKITKGELNGRELNEVLAAVESINKDEKIILSYSVHFSKIKRELSMDDYDIAMVDYLQLITPDVVTERRLQIANISRGIKQLAVMKDKPIILLSQVNRKTTDAPGKRPGMENLAESAAIEQDADNIAFLHRPSYYLDEELKEELTDEEMADTEIIIAKQRDGLRTTVKCIFSKGRFYEGIKEEEKNDGTSPF